MAERILLIDDDDRLAEMLSAWFGPRGVRLERASDGLGGLAAARTLRPDAVILDVMLPDIEGFEVLRRLRTFSEVPVLMLTARGEDTDRIVGLEMGADDYLPKPFNPRELLARLRAILRRRTPVAAGLLRFGSLEIDRDQRTVRLDGQDRPLTAHQFDLLLALAEHPGTVQSRADLMDRVRGAELEAFDRSIDVHISRIRAAIERDPANPRRILTLRGRGYLFVAAEDA
jgi:two-component system, OmpR family, phosphate regulon response regulator OmpR